MTFDIHAKFAAYKKRKEAEVAGLKAEIKKLKGCRHLRVSSMRIKSGYDKECLSCGFRWREMDEPLTKEGQAAKSAFGGWQRHNAWREEKGFKPIGCE